MGDLAVGALYDHDGGFMYGALYTFNRWGTPVYTTSNYENNWSGEGLSSGEYYHRVFSDSCGEEVKGWIHVIR
ncbi:MAG: gliding motility-associated C-terminal domain-containing protein [Bacteroidota bacterium]|nr:MAG: hypothetical protein DIU61_11165 [Bacteroidota bacterium]